jgi:hypothetical protein
MWTKLDRRREIFSQRLVGVDWAFDIVEGVGQRALMSSGEVYESESDVAALMAADG